MPATFFPELRWRHCRGVELGRDREPLPQRGPAAWHDVVAFATLDDNGAVRQVVHLGAARFDHDAEPTGRILVRHRHGFDVDAFLSERRASPPAGVAGR